jgi:hypothetical protein
MEVSRFDKVHALPILIQEAESPIRISPTMLLFPRPSALKDIYWDPKCNQKAAMYGTGA